MLFAFGLTWNPVWGQGETGATEEGQEEAQPVTEDETLEGEEETKVAALLDDDTTRDLHDDSTLLRNVPSLSEEGLTLFNALRIWAGGALQYDYYNFDGIYNFTSDGERSEGANFRRMEGMVRAQLFDWGELKAQYDLDAGIFRDLYLRWVSDRPETPVTVTIGNQKEPIGLNHLTGNKISIGQERASPADAFGRWRSKGVRLHKAFLLDADKRKFDYYDDDAAFMTTSVGIFTQDIEKTHDTDLAVTARVTAGREKGGEGMHIGLAASYREGEFDHIRFRPEIREASRIALAEPDANTMGIAALEGAYGKGRLHLQGEAYYAQYAGRIDGYGGGAYVEAGWFLTQDSRDYNARWGTIAAHSPSGRFSVDIFGRLSHTRGDDDVTGWNDYKSITLGSNFYYRKARASINLLYGESREPIGSEEDGFAINIRAQYMF